MKKIVVTGADGFIGINLIKKLLSEEMEVCAIVHPASTTKERLYALSGIHLNCIECEISEIEQHMESLPEEPDAFYHLAWAGVNASVRDSLEVQMQNIDLCIRCIFLASRIHTKKFIMPGSTNEYLYYGKPIDEKAVPSPQNAYGSVKVALRYLAQQYARQCGVGFIYVVITGIYAADRRDNNVIFYTIDKLLHGEKPSLTRCEQLWDYVNIKDVVQALWLIGISGKAGAFYAVGHGDNQPLYEYINEIHDIINPNIPLGMGEIPYDGPELPSSCINLAKVKEDTAFEPRVDFRDGIREVIETMKKEMLR